MTASTAIQWCPLVANTGRAAFEQAEVVVAAATGSPTVARLAAGGIWQGELRPDFQLRASHYVVFTTSLSSLRLRIYVAPQARPTIFNFVS